MSTSASTQSIPPGPEGFWHRVQKWVTTAIAIIGAGGMGIQSLIAAKADSGSMVDAVIKLGFPTALALFGILWFFTSYLPRQERREEKRDADRDAQHRLEVEHLRAVMLTEREAAEEREARLMHSYEESIARIMGGVAELKTELKAEIRSLRDRVDATGPQRRLP